MSTAEPSFLEALASAAASAQKAEIAFRASITREIDRHERERQFAFRRLGIAREMAKAAATAENEEAAVSAQIAAFRSELGWFGESDHYQRPCEVWREVALAVWRDAMAARGEAGTVAQAEGPGVRESMQAFEAWYESEFGRNYLAILDQEIPELPIVEF